MARSSPLSTLAGVALPVAPSAAGGFRLARGADYVRELVFLALGPCDSLNPFQQELDALGDKDVFQLPSTAWTAALTARARRIFDVRLAPAGLARLRKLTLNRGEAGERLLTVEYDDLLNRQPGQVDIPLAS